MCGIVGAVSPQHRISEAEVVAMTDLLAHRGPDDSGTWAEADVILGHRRLAVIDLSVEGHQPMLSADGRFAMVYNGEVYNFAELRRTLGGIAWRGGSDSEVILEAIARWGVEAAVSRFVGMFALAVYDRAQRQLWLVRDRLGIKPLYYGDHQGDLLFASELHVVDALASPRPSINRQALVALLRFSYVPGPLSIYEGFHKVPPGCTVRFDLDREPVVAPVITRYWNPAAALGVHALISDEEAEAQLLAHLRDAVRCRMIADVPLGAFLSGGIDSTLICALLQEASVAPIKTFTIGFEQRAFDEAEHARAVAAHLGTDHHELYVSPDDMLAAVTKLPEMCDEPFSDASLLPTYLVSSMARSTVTVALSGDGGDELFGGYLRYALTERLWAAQKWIPNVLRGGLASMLSSAPLRAATRGIRTPAWMGRRSTLSDKLYHAAGVVGAADIDALYFSLISHWKNPTELVIGGSQPVREPESIYNDPSHWSAAQEPSRRFAIKDLLSYLPHDILTKVDRASMNVSLEARVPLLDHRVVEFCLGLPDHMLKRSGQTKWLLKRLLNRYVPPTLIDRPKQGFGVPLGDWLRGPLRDWAGDLLNRDRLDREGYLRSAPVVQAFEAHQRGDGDWSAYLWDVLMFQSWLEARGQRRSASAAS